MTDKLRQAAEVALEALRTAQNNLAPCREDAEDFGDGDIWNVYDEAIFDLRQALAEPDTEVDYWRKKAEQLEQENFGWRTKLNVRGYEIEIESLRQALAEPPNSTTDVVEPIGEIQVEQMGRPFNAGKVVLHFYGEPPPVGTKLYAALPKREWQGLTDEDIEEIWGEPVGFMYSGHYYAIREVEDRLKEKNNAP
jgi:hypothetical protein